MAGVGEQDSDSRVTLLLTGDVMIGRGIDQILPHAGDPALHEEYVRSASEYVALAERVHGAIPRQVPFDYIWGDALVELERRRPDLTLINLETTITARGAPEPKGINYRMHPANIGVLTAAHIGACTLANNHVLDWGMEGLTDTLDALRAAGIVAAGAGRDLREASAALVVPVAGRRRVIIIAAGCRDSGIPVHWKALPSRGGLHLLTSLSRAAARDLAGAIRAHKQPGDIMVASIHWGGNWGYEIPDEQREFARALIDDAMVDVVHGHSSHHSKAIEVYRGKLILYGCGDLIDDYEGIAGYEQFRDDLVLMYFATISVHDGTLCRLEMAPFRIHRFRLQAAVRHEAEWLATTLSRETGSLGTHVNVTPDNMLRLNWTRGTTSD
jgi:poly-gamma-glutamate synthesis protein (capsule biosynthesis protein)